MRRAGGKADGKLLQYLKVRIDMLREERNKTENEQTHLILDKSIIQFNLIVKSL